MNNTIFVITDDSSVYPIVKASLDDRYKIKIFEDIHPAISNVFDTFPELIIAQIKDVNDRLIEFINIIKTDSIFGQIAVLVIIPDNLHFNILDALLADDFIRYSDIKRDMKMRIEMSFLRIQRIIELNPLTRLPGNISIQKEITRKIQKDDKFAIAYADIDFFKPYNDKYGFSRGDEVIKMLGRLIFNIVRLDQPKNSFVGHIGGDDFIYIMDIETIENTSHKIIEEFDKIIPIFYEQADRENGFIESIDRSGKKMRFPIMSLSVGITDNKEKKFQHYGEISQVLAEMKNYAKSMKGSFYMLDRRK